MTPLGVNNKILVQSDPPFTTRIQPVNREKEDYGSEVRMELGSREIESMLAARHGIVGERQIAFRGRLEHLRKLGCPTGVQTGKGRPAVFGWQQLIELAAALELINLGISPDEVARVIKVHHNRLRLHAAGLGSVVLSQRALIDATQRQKWPFPKTHFLLLDVGALSGLQADGGKRDPLLHVLDSRAYVEELKSAPADAAAIVTVDLGTMIANLLYLVSGWLRWGVSETAGDFSDWANANVLNS